MGYDYDGCVKTGYMGEANIRSDIWINGRARNVENKNQPGIEGAV